MSSIGKRGRTIEVAQITEVDAFSDEVKVGGLIEEIEAAEAAAKQAMIERQIRESTPGIFRRFTTSFGEFVKEKRMAVAEGVATLRTKVPEEPKVRRPKLKAPKMPKVVLPKVRMPRVKFPELKMPTVKFPRLRLPRISWHPVRWVNSLAPEGVSRKGLITACLGAAAFVTAAELGAWAMTHPYIAVREVPKTGATTEMKTTEAAPVSEPTEEETTEATEETAEETTSTPRTYNAARTSSGGSVSNKTTQTTTTTTTTSRNGTGTYVDSQLADGEMVEQPAEEPAEEEATGDETEED